MNLSEQFAAIDDQHEINLAVKKAWFEAVEEFGIDEGFEVIRSAIARALINERQACIEVVQTELNRRDLSATARDIDQMLWKRD